MEKTRSRANFLRRIGAAAIRVAAFALDAAEPADPDPVEGRGLVEFSERERRVMVQPRPTAWVWDCQKT
jgi:hypothetical protein